MDIVPFPAAAAASAAATEMMQFTRRQAPARKVLRDALKARATQLRALGVDQEAVQLDALRFAQAVHALLPRKRVAGADEQIANKIAIHDRRGCLWLT